MSASLTRARAMISSQEIARIAMLCKNNDRADAIRFLENDYDRQWNEWHSAVNDTSAQLPEPRSLKLVSNAIEFLKDNPKWDCRVQYELIDPEALRELK